MLISELFDKIQEIPEVAMVKGAVGYYIIAKIPIEIADKNWERMREIRIELRDLIWEAGGAFDGTGIGLGYYDIYLYAPNTPQAESARQRIERMQDGEGIDETTDAQTTGQGAAYSTAS